MSEYTKIVKSHLAIAKAELQMAIRAVEAAEKRFKDAEDRKESLAEEVAPGTTYISDIHTQLGTAMNAATAAQRNIGRAKTVVAEGL